ncbi:hypothetical protein [Pseudaminobacter salicylatoxidans]|uniref:hypothetical protein n=1 Tax=Pseudaminobacter salicylatoxidans TaxID=93369 RepID=UPI00037609CA|nr:hypothetical protein [Pseudaminobacter salicylatoxidans]
MGAGHFGLMCAAFGHLTYGLDLDDSFYEDFCNAFGLTRKTKAIKKFEPLPDFGTKFDIITAFSLMFHFENYGTHRVYWQRDEWGWFLSDICKHLNPEASVYLIINPELLPDGRIEMQHKLTELFARSGAKVLIPGRAVLWQVKDAKIALPGPDIPEGLFTDQIKRL